MQVDILEIWWCGGELATNLGLLLWPHGGTAGRAPLHQAAHRRRAMAPPSLRALLAIAGYGGQVPGPCHAPSTRAEGLGLNE